ncbi:MAG: hypothetical protein ACREJ5_21800 [Geminicoccaceae bacterium]
MDEALAGQIRRNQQLDEGLADAETARERAAAEAAKIRAEMAAKLEAATAAAEQSSGELAGLREELDETRKELATANGAREEVGEWVSELEKVVERSAADAERLKTELAAVKEQLGQAVGAAIQAERARLAASNEAESRRHEAAQARDQLTTATTEIERFKTANAELEKEVASWRTSSASAIETARQNLVMMEKKIEELNAALDLGPPEEAAPALSAQTKPASPEDERSSTATTRPPSASARPSAPEPASKTGDGQAADRPVSSFPRPSSPW